MSPPDPCPPVADFEAMLLGRLADARAAVLEGHIETCPACQRLLDGLAVDTRLTAALRGTPAADPDPAADPGVGAMVARLEDMARQFTPAGFDLSAPSDAGPDADGAAFDPSPAPGGPDRMGVYRVVRLLGAGGMGLVYLAEDEVLCRQVAVKVLRPRLARQTRARDGFLREARAMAALKHDNVVTVFQVGEAAGPGGDPVPFLAMELLEGESLADWLRREGPVPAGWAARLGRQAADGLAAAHARGVVHRDIKPGNLWLEAPPGWADLPVDQRPPLPVVARVKVLDFGLAQPAGEDGPGGGRVVFGTPAYMAPEQAAGREADPRADLFSLGVVLYELATGQRPFPREGKREPATYPPPTPVADLAPDLTPDLAGLIHRLLSPDPAARPGSARQVAEDLTALAADTVPISTRSPRAGSPRRLWAGGAAVGVALALAAGIWLAVRPHGSDSSSPLSDTLAEPGPPDDRWAQAVAGLPVERQPMAVTAKLRELNPGYDGQITRLGFEGTTVTEFSILTDEVGDIRPIRALTGLKSLTVVGSAPGKGKLADLSPIHGLPLTTLNVWQNPALADLSPVLGMRLTLFQAGDTAVEDLTPLAGMPLDLVAVNNCRVKDLSPVRTMPKIRFVRCDGCPIETLAPLIGSRVRELTFAFNEARGDAAILDKLPALEQINRMPANEFRRHHPARR